MSNAHCPAILTSSAMSGIDLSVTGRDRFASHAMRDEVVHKLQRRFPRVMFGARVSADGAVLTVDFAPMTLGQEVVYSVESWNAEAISRAVLAKAYPA